MSNDQSFKPDWASAPGETIADILRQKNLGVSAFSGRIGRSPAVVSDLLAGQFPIDDKLAVELERILGGSTAFWINREAQYRGDSIRLEALAQQGVRDHWLRELPLRDMINFG